MKELRHDLEAPEFAEWIAFYELEAEDEEAAREGKQPRPPVTRDPAQIREWFGKN